MRKVCTPTLLKPDAVTPDYDLVYGGERPVSSSSQTWFSLPVAIAALHSGSLGHHHPATQPVCRLAILQAPSYQDSVYAPTPVGYKVPVLDGYSATKVSQSPHKASSSKGRRYRALLGHREFGRR